MESTLIPPEIKEEAPIIEVQPIEIRSEIKQEKPVYFLARHFLLLIIIIISIIVIFSLIYLNGKSIYTYGI